MNKVSNKEDQYPAVKGYLLEFVFFASLHLLIVIANGEEKPFFVTFSDYHIEHVDAVIDTMGANTMYHLRNDHLIINCG